MSKYCYLPENLSIDEKTKSKIEHDYMMFCNDRLPEDINGYVLNEYGVDISSRYGDLYIKNPFGVASGQLSTNVKQVGNYIKDGMGFVVLKTVISEDRSGNSSMEAWKVDAPKMVVEEIVSREGEKGYTVTWKGRGWHKSFEEYLDFMKQSLSMSKASGVPVIPSCKFNLPHSVEDGFNDDEYIYTLNKFEKVWRDAAIGSTLYLEKDFSPTLAGSDLAKDREMILWWLDNVPEKIKKSLPQSEIRLGIKLMNAVYEDEFQIDMLKTILKPDHPFADFLICFNRLFDSSKVFEGKKGVAYGGYDLSDRNLRVLTELRKLQRRGEIEIRDIPISATGNINSGKMMVEYALRGCSSGQIHTYLQLPMQEYGMKSGNRTSRVLNELLFNPGYGLLSSIIYLYEKGVVEKKDGIVNFTDIIDAYKHADIF